MARNTSVSLGDHFTAFVDEQVQTGRYGSASDVIRAGLRLLEREEQQVAWLRLKMAEAEAEIRAGLVYDSTPEFWEELHREAVERAARGERPGLDVLP
jgi:antitoxin ParD1/3/4